MFFYDSSYMFIMIIGFALVLIPQMLVKSTYAKYAKVDNKRNLSGADVARAILHNAGITDIKVEPVEGELTDHYDPSKKVVRLSEKNYYGKSIAALGVSAHEIGHVIQDKKGFIPMKIRAAIVPAANIGQSLGPILIMVGIGLRAIAHVGGMSDLVALTGIIFYAAIVLFHIITLPVEFDASFRAIGLLSNGGYIEINEKPAAMKVLGAAAMTYVATALYALMELLYWIWRLYGSRRD
ncbi:MAG: zinc metallopeptidase [Candidatus Gastranaerophilaceae bacterium]